MGAGELLRRLDRAVLPPLGRALAWCLTGAARRRLVVAAGVAGTTALLVASVWAAHEPPPATYGTGTLVRVGVTEGQSIDAYTEQASRELAALTDRGGPEAYALASFTAFLAPDRFGRLVRGVSVHRVYGRATLPGVAADVVEITGDLRDGMLRVAAQRDAQARSYRRDAAKLTGASDVEREHRESYLAEAEQAAAEAAAYRSMCSCLYAAVVRGAPRLLDRLADAPGVRAVDPAPEVTDLDSAVFVPPLPDQPGDTGPAPAPSASGSPTPPDSPSPSPTTSDPAPSSTPPADPSIPPSESPSPTGDGHSPPDGSSGDD